MSVLTRIRPDLRDFVPYASARRAGTAARICLDANESPWPQASVAALNRYPAPQPPELLDALATLYGTDPSHLWIGRGSDEAIDLLVRAFCRPGIDNIVSITPTFGMYRIAARLQGAAIREVTLDRRDGFALDPERLLAAADACTRIVVLCSPNNPTGTLHHDAIDWLARELAGRALLLVDEAYIEFAGTSSAVGRVGRFDNLAVLRTLSKAHALAGARVGTLVAAPALATLIGAIAAPYPLPTGSAQAALAGLHPDALALTRERVALAISERERVSNALSDAPDVLAVFPSAGNFLLIHCVDAAQRFASLLDAGIRVRDVSMQPGLANCLRIGIGRPDENDELLTVFGYVAQRRRNPEKVA